MEILRELYGTLQMNALPSRYFGTYKDYRGCDTIDFNTPHVFKLASGAQSTNVKLMRSKKEHISIPKTESGTFSWYYWIVDQIKPFFGKKYPITEGNS